MAVRRRVPGAGAQRGAARLKRDFDLNPAGLALALTYLERIRELEARLRRLECRLMR